MSRAPGRIQRELEELLLAHPDSVFTIAGIARAIYQLDQVERRHRIAVSRALPHVLARNPGWVKYGKRLRSEHRVGRPERLIYNSQSWTSVKAAGRAGYMGDGENLARERYFAELMRNPVMRLRLQNRPSARRRCGSVPGFPDRSRAEFRRPADND